MQNVSNLQVVLENYKWYFEIGYLGLNMNYLENEHFD